MSESEFTPEFIDYSNNTPQPLIDSEEQQAAWERRMHKGMSRRGFLGAVATTAAITTMSKDAFA